MFDDVISTGLQAVLAEIFESVDKNQLNVSLVGDIFKESHLELTDLRLKKTLLKDMNLPVEVKEGLVGKLVIQGLSGVMTGDPVTVTVSEVLVLLAPGATLSDAEAGLAARRILATLREMFANRYGDDFLEDALGIKLEDRMSVQSKNKLNRKLLRHIVRKLLAGISINLQTVHVRFELPAGGLQGAPVKASTGVGGGGACDAVGVMLPSFSLRTCNTDHPAFAKFASSTPLDRVTSAKNRGAAGTGGAGAGGATAAAAAAAATAAAAAAVAAAAAKQAESDKLEKKNFVIVRKRATFANLQVYCDYGVDSYATAISAAVSAARAKATNPRSGSLGGGGVSGRGGGESAGAKGGRGAAAAARAVRMLFLQKWKSERHALLFKPLAVEVGVEVHQWDQPGGKAITPVYRAARVNVGVGELQAIVDSEQGRVIGVAVDAVVNLIRRSRYNRFVPQAYLPLRNLPPPKVRPPKPAKDGAPAGMLPSVETWSWSSESEAGRAGGGSVRPRSAAEAVRCGGYKHAGGAWARAMWRFAGACVRHDVRMAMTKKLPASLPQWNGTLSPLPPSSNGNNNGTSNGNYAVNGNNGNFSGKRAGAGAAGENELASWRVGYLRLHARTLTARDAKSTAHRVPDVRRMGVPKGREPLSLEEMWEMARVESFAPGDEVVFLRTAARVSSHYEWGRARRARASAKSSASQWGSSAGGGGGVSSTAVVWTAKDDATLLANMDALRVKRAEAVIAEEELARRGGGRGGGGAGGEGAEEEEDDDDVEIAKMEFSAKASSGFSDEEDESGSETEDDSSDDDSDDSEAEATVANGTRTGGGAGGGGGRVGARFSLADIAAKANASSAASAQASANASAAAAAAAAARATEVFAAGSRKGVAGGPGGKAAKLWSKLLGLPRVVFKVESAGIELRTRISGGARRPLVALSAGGLSGTMEGDELRRVLWWELRVGNVTLRDLCSSWGVGGGNKAPVARTVLSGSASAEEGREWAAGGDASGAAARSFLVARVVHDPNRLACGLFQGSASSGAELRAHVVLGCVTGKIPPQVLAVFNAAARDIVLTKKGRRPSIPLSNHAPSSSPSTSRTAAAAAAAAAAADDSARQLRVAVGALHKAIASPKSITFRPKKRQGPRAAVRALSLARGAVAGGGVGGGRTSSSSPGEIDSKELYKVVAGILPGDFEVRVHTSQVIVQVDSRAEDLLTAGKVALEAMGEVGAAAGMSAGSAAADGIQLEVNVNPVKIDACRSSLPSPELWVDTGIMRAKLRAPEKAVEAVVTALLSSAQKTKAAVALLSGAADETAPTA